MLFKGISYLKLWQPFCSVERNHLCNFSRGYPEGLFCDFFEFGSVVQEEMSIKIFLIWSSGDPRVRWNVTIYAILKEGIMGNIQVKLYEIWAGGSGEDTV